MKKPELIILIFRIVLAAIGTASCGFFVFIGGALVHGFIMGSLTVLAAIGGILMIFFSILAWAYFIVKVFK